MKRFSDIREIDRAQIITDPSRFQGRQGEFSEDTVKAIVSKGTYDKSAEPIVVWQDPQTGQYIVISGHSRFEATKRLYESGKQPDLKTIPVKVFLGDEDDAIDYATLESNRGSTEEGLLSDIAAYKRAVSKGYNRQKLLTIFKPESKLNKLKDLSYLNRKGRFIEALGSDANRSYPYLERNARWVGVLRKQLPQLSDAHENEIFKYLYADGSKKGLNLKKDQFNDLIDKRVNRIDFEPDQPLNLANRISSNALTDPISNQIKDLDKEIDQLNGQIANKRQTIISAKEQGKDNLVPKFQKDIKDLEAIILKKMQEQNRLRQQKGKVERETVVDLFSMDQPAPAPEPKPKAEHTNPPMDYLPEDRPKAKQAALNADIKRFVLEKEASGEEYTLKDIQYVQQYAGDGGIETGTRGSLYEYYTPDYIISRMWSLARKHGFTTGNILEPAVGTGKFLRYVDVSNCYVDAFEFSKTNRISYLIAKNTYPFANITNDYFESIFYEQGERKQTTDKYDLVIGNPPYDKFSGKYANKSLEGKRFKGTSYAEYFMWAGLKLLKPSGVLVMIIPSSFFRSGQKDIKTELAAMADLKEAIALPRSVFKHTQIETTIVVFKKQDGNS